MEILISEARTFDLLEAVDDTGRPIRWTRGRLATFARQISAGPCVTIRVYGQLALVVGLWPEADHAEAWFAAGVALGWAPARAIRTAKRLLEAVAEDATAGAAEGLEVRAYLHPASVAGRRLAALFGFTEGGTSESPIGPLAMWTRQFA